VAGQTLLQYLTTTRFILHDPNAKTFSDAQLVNCINLARDEVISVTSSPQAVVAFPTVAGQFTYSFNTILASVLNQGLPARAVQSVLGVNFYQGPLTGVALQPLAWSVFNMRFRLTPTPSLPDSYAVPDIGGGNSNLYIGPPPSSGGPWTLEVRCCWLGNNMANYTDTEAVVPSPIAEAAVPILAAKWAWSFNNDEEMADKFETKGDRIIERFAANMPPFAAEPFASIYD
jgi:hypothetical protein